MAFEGRSKRRVGTREIEVRLAGWCEGGVGQQRNDGGGCPSMNERSERVASPGTYVASSGTYVASSGTYVASSGTYVTE